MEWWHVYLICIADDVNDIAVAGCALIAVMSIFAISAVLVGLESDDDVFLGSGKRWLKIFLPIFFLLLLVSLVVPDTKQLAAIYLIPKIVNNEEVKAVPDNALKLLNLKMEEWIEETVGEGEK